MKGGVPTAVIGVCTFQRPRMLGRCLGSLCEMDNPANVAVSVIVVDNDREGSAWPVVSGVQSDASCPVSVFYETEERRGIPFARNRLLARAQEMDADYVAFIDDDEYVDGCWFTELWSHLTASGADVVRGPVLLRYPSSAPDWVRENRIFERKNAPTGTRFQSAATNNVLFNARKIVCDWGIRFDEAFGLMGGSDTDFFTRAYARGAVIEHVSTAFVYENFESDRLSLSYFMKRTFRAANEPAKYRNCSVLRKVKLLLRAAKNLFLHGLLLPVSFAHGLVGVAPRIAAIATASGRILALVGIRFTWKEYSRT